MKRVNKQKNTKCDLKKVRQSVYRQNYECMYVCMHVSMYVCISVSYFGLELIQKHMQHTNTVRGTEGDGRYAFSGHGHGPRHCLFIASSGHGHGPHY